MTVKEIEAKRETIRLADERLELKTWFDVEDKHLNDDNSLTNEGWEYLTGDKILALPSPLVLLDISGVGGDFNVDEWLAHCRKFGLSWIDVGVKENTDRGFVSSTGVMSKLFYTVRDSAAAKTNNDLDRWKDLYPYIYRETLKQDYKRDDYGSLNHLFDKKITEGNFDSIRNPLGLKDITREPITWLDLDAPADANVFPITKIKERLKELEDAPGIKGESIDIKLDTDWCGLYDFYRKEIEKIMCASYKTSFPPKDEEE